MDIKEITCIECPVGCRIEVGVENGVATYVKGNGCPRGKAYAENEVVCPKRIITTTVRCENGKMLSVKTDKAVKKADMFEIMKTINAFVAKTPVRIGQVLIKNISEDSNLIATQNVE